MTDQPYLGADLPDTSDLPESARAAIDRMAREIVPSTRADGWTGERQRRFLEAIAEGSTVEQACRLVRLSPASAYAFRRRARGQAFALGWSAANLLAREHWADALYSRATEGQTVEVTRADGSTVTRHYYDNRLAMSILSRLDRYADESERTAPGRGARLVAAEFDAYLDLVEHDGGPARAGLFMLSRETSPDAAESELEPVIALARADRMARCGSALASEVSCADLDPARRETWTAEQWMRAEAAGLLRLAPPPAADEEGADVEEDATRSLLSQLGRDAEGGVPPELCVGSGPVRFDREAGEWFTRFPPPDGFDGDEYGEWGDTDYQRTLTPEEETTAVARMGRFYGIVTLEDAEAERERWFRAADKSADHIGATPASPAGGSAAPKRPSPSDAEGEAALALPAEHAPQNDATAAPLPQAGTEQENPEPAAKLTETAAAVAQAPAPIVNDHDPELTATPMPTHPPIT